MIIVSAAAGYDGSPGLPHDRLTWQCEQAVRNYHPCISCWAHFLDLPVVNRSG